MMPPAISADRIRLLLDRNLQEVFGETDDVRRRAAVDELWTENAILYAPSGPIVGRAAIAQFASDLRATHPHYVYTAHGIAQVLHDAGQLRWGSGARGEAPAYTGTDFIVVRDGLIAILYVLLDESTDEFRRASGRA